VQRYNQNARVAEINIPLAVKISKAIPEFSNPYAEKTYIQRLKGKKALLLGIFIENEPAGFKAGYALNENDFYSWMGGVLPGFRRQGLAKLLADKQEEWAIQEGFQTIHMKTRNHHKAMLCFALNNGFALSGFEKRKTIDQHRIYLEKNI
jgi:GNAT superfamily N-acetyltransferase